jgi:N-acylneuraminate cytidylyltransferase
MGEPGPDGAARRRPGLRHLLDPAADQPVPARDDDRSGDGAARPGADSLRAVRLVSEHPGKMWVLRGDVMLPLLPLSPDGPPWHSRQYAALPEVYVQNASLEIAWARVALEGGTIAGEVVIPWISDGYDGFDINKPEDWERTLAVIDSGRAELPAIDRPPFPGALPGDGKPSLPDRTG